MLDHDVFHEMLYLLQSVVHGHHLRHVCVEHYVLLIDDNLLKILLHKLSILLYDICHLVKLCVQQYLHVSIDILSPLYLDAEDVLFKGLLVKFVLVYLLKSIVKFL